MINKYINLLEKKITIKLYQAMTIFVFGFVSAFIILNTYYAKQSASVWEHNINHYKYENKNPDSLKMQKL